MGENPGTCKPTADLIFVTAGNYLGPGSVML